MITDALFELKSFQRQYDAVLQIAVGDTIPNLTWSIPRDRILNNIDWNNLLGISSILCYSDKSEHLDAALRIAQTCLSISQSDKQKSASAVILETLTNHPALQLAITRQLIQPNYKDNLSLTFQLQTVKTAFENTTLVAGQIRRLNRFQKNVYEAYKSNEAISISAPTSAGKSFILYNAVIDSVCDGQHNRIVYIVPTRALISQVEEDLRFLLKEHALTDVNISTVPQFEDAKGSHIFVFTQERLHWFLIEHENVTIDILIVDEAQKIEDGNRGILLEQKIEEVLRLNPSVKVFFSSPFTSNPEILLESFKNAEQKKVVDTQFVSVNQNLIYVSQIPRKVDEYNVRLIFTEKHFDLGRLKLRDRPGVSEYKKLGFIADAFSAGSYGNLVYSNGAAEAETIAAIFYSLMKDIDDEALDDLIKLVAGTVHRRYSLVTVLRRGVAFHYGNMPLLIRQEIERLFKEGIIKVLICTSTLLEGVNLPAKTVFIRKPTRGRNRPLSSSDFWNLAGRAGRWGKEFSGNIVCIDPTQWASPPNPNKTKQVIKRATDVIKSNPDELIEYIKSGSPRQIAESRQDLEFAFGYYFNKHLINELRDNNAFFVELNSLFKEIQKSITIPNYLFRRNPGISPIAQQSLFDYFKSKNDEVEDLIPVYPEDDNGFEEYTKLVGRIGETLAFYPPALNTSRAILLINWMSGKPLSYIISASYSSYQRNTKFKKIKTLPVVIRECMDNVENFVRFRFAKDSSCYVDILRHYLGISDRTDLLTKIPEISLWLEFGVSQKTHLSLLALGLTRSTVTEITQYIPVSQMNKDEALSWLKSFDYNAIELSPIMKEDIKKCIE